MFLVRLAHHSKSPVAGPLQISDDPGVHHAWLEAGDNVGNRLVENGLVGVDYDTIEGAREAWVSFVQTGLCNLAVRTRRGIHLIFTGTTETHPEDGRDKKGNGHLVCPPSVVRHKDGSLWKYHFVRGDENTKPLPFPEHLFPKPENKTLSTNIELQPDDDRLQIISRAMDYAATMNSVGTGSQGDDALFRFACHMVRNPPNGFGLTIAEAWPIALMFNQRCQPAWRDHVIRRKLIEAKRKG